MIAGITHPELVIVSGPLAGCPFYVQGLRNALDEAWQDVGDAVPVQISDMTWRAAARWLAINEFLLRRDIDLTLLMERKAA